MFNILGHHGNTNQNYYEISSYIMSEWLRSTIYMTTHAGEDIKQEEPSSIAGESANLHSHYGNQGDSVSENWE